MLGLGADFSLQLLNNLQRETGAASHHLGSQSLGQEILCRLQLGLVGSFLTTGEQTFLITITAAFHHAGCVGELHASLLLLLLHSGDCFVQLPGEGGLCRSFPDIIIEQAQFAVKGGGVRAGGGAFQCNAGANHSIGSARLTAWSRLGRDSRPLRTSFLYSAVERTKVPAGRRGQGCLLTAPSERSEV